MRRTVSRCSSPGYFRLVQLQRTPPQIAIVAERFHVKPMLRIVQSADRYQVLALTRRDIRMFEGNRDVLDEIDLAPGVPRTITEALGEEITQKQVFDIVGTGHVAGSPGGRNYRGMKMGIRHGPVLRDDEIGVDIERFFRAVARAVHEHHSKPSGLPLILAAPAQYHTHFRSVSQNPQLLDRAIDINPAALTVEDLRARAWEVMEPEYLRRLSTLLDRYGAAHGAGNRHRRSDRRGAGRAAGTRGHFAAGSRTPHSRPHRQRRPAHRRPHRPRSQRRARRPRANGSADQRAGRDSAHRAHADPDRAGCYFPLLTDGDTRDPDPTPAADDPTPPGSPGDEVPPGTPGAGEHLCRACGGSGELTAKPVRNVKGQAR